MCLCPRPSRVRAGQDRVYSPPVGRIRRPEPRTSRLGWATRTLRPSSTRVVSSPRPSRRKDGGTDGGRLCTWGHPHLQHVPCGRADPPRGLHREGRGRTQSPGAPIDRERLPHLPLSLERGARTPTAPTAAEATPTTSSSRLRSPGTTLLPSVDIWRGRRHRKRRPHTTRHTSPPNRRDSPPGPIGDPRHLDSVGTVCRSRRDGEFPPHGALRLSSNREGVRPARTVRHRPTAGRHPETHLEPRPLP